MADTQANDNNTCVVCFKNVLYYSIGECDHPVCYECSTRMRVLCLQNECPICRQALSKVIFLQSIEPYKDIRNKAFSDKLFDMQFKIGFYDEDIKLAYEKLLQNICKICDKQPPFRSFSALSDHMRRVHEKFYCDLCVKHLKIFTNERKCYTRSELAHHRRKGDVDDTSHRGHPLCEFCEQRFMDPDELYRHLRKEHLYCHLCDADGQNHYYATHTALAQHFRSDHYLCEEGECAGQHLTAVFRTDIDLKAHKASVHGKGLARSAARQARTLELQFNITPHTVAQRPPRVEAAVVSGTGTVPLSPTPPPLKRDIDTGSVEQFPRLSAAPAAPMLLTAPSRVYKGGDSLKRDDKNFPALDGTSAGPSRPVSSQGSSTVASAVLRNTKPSVSIQLHSQPTTANNFRLTQATGNRISIPKPRKEPISEEDFPSLGGALKDDHPSIGSGTVQPSKISVMSSQEMQSVKGNQQSKSKKMPQNIEAFPALSATSVPTAPPQWITVSKSKDKPKKKPEPPPVKAPAFNPLSDFPNLPLDKANNQAKKQINRSQHPPTEKSSKNDKKKLSNKKENVGDFNHYNGNSEKDCKANGIDNYHATAVDSKIKIVDNNAKTEKRSGGKKFNMAASDYPPLSNCDVAPPVCNFPKPKLSNGANATPRPPFEGMTFTNSSGQTFPAPLHSYIPPPNFEQRNRILFKNLAEALGGNDAFECFKEMSRNFRFGVITADEFFIHCESMLNSRLDSVFPELVALLPDIGKQQELVVGRKVGRLKVCSVCGQMVSPTDSIAHDTEHWPPLSR